MLKIKKAKRKEQMPEEQPLQKPKRKINERSTKQELWEAYNKMLLQTEKEPVTVELTQKEIATSDAFKQLSDLKLKISQQLDSAGEELLNDLNKLSQTRHMIGGEKRRLVEHFEEQREDLIKEIDKVKKTWEDHLQLEKEKFAEEQKQKEIALKRNEEEYQYNFKIKRRNEDDEYTRLKEERERKFQEKESVLKEKEEELTVASAKLNHEANRAKEILIQELTEKHSSKIREITLDFGREKKIYELKITNLETTIKAQSAEIEDLKKQLENASRQLKEMAVSVIERHSAEKVQNNEDA